VKQAGFTLLETLVALSIMLVAFSAILMAESASLNSALKAKQMNVVSMLAKNIMVETEYKIEGKPFSEVKKEEGGVFPPPHENYRWMRTIKEIKFPTLSFGKAGGEDQSETTNHMERLARLMSKYLSKAIREVSVTVSWKKGSGEQSFSVTTYWVNLNHAFELSE